MISVVFLGLMLIATACCGAIISFKIRNEEISQLWAFLPAIPSTYIWLQFVKSNISLQLASVGFDVAYGLAYLIAFYALGEKLTTLQIIGALIAIFGTALMAH